MFKPQSDFNLEKNVSAWRRQLLAAGITSTDTVNELESHLREDFRALVSAGEPEAEAFRHALARLGTPSEVRVEFTKLGKGEEGGMRAIAILWLGAMAAMAIFLSGRVFDGRMNFVVYLHILTVTAGYGMALLLGGVGIYELLRQRLGRVLSTRRESFVRPARMFSACAAILVIAGTVLGMFVSRRLFGNYWGWDPKEIGALCVIGWFLAIWVMPLYGWLSDRAALLMSVGGNIVVMLAWFGAGIMDHNERVPAGKVGYWPLAIGVGVHLCVIALGAVQKPTGAEAGN